MSHFLALLGQLEQTKAPKLHQQFHTLLPMEHRQSQHLHITFPSEAQSKHLCKPSTTYQYFLILPAEQGSAELLNLHSQLLSTLYIKISITAHF